MRRASPTCACGSSPRVRGTLLPRHAVLAALRFIPAGAGNARRTPARVAAAPVHPRGCGERTPADHLRAIEHGSSPRVRGTPPPAARADAHHRFIPAGAGNALRRRRASRCTPVHPRGCGERALALRPRALDHGSSPRVRGTLRRRANDIEPARFIPAGAGNARPLAPSPLSGPVHPRGCGERVLSGDTLNLASGSSPRVRGTLARSDGRAAPRRFIPAGAGNAAMSAPRCAPTPVHPRGCGEREEAGDAITGGAGSSPRVRGTHSKHGRPEGRPRFIPAGAGNASNSPGARRPSAVHPRGCGERRSPGMADHPIIGSSPRVRGTPARQVRAAQHGRFIPAGAGNAGTKRSSWPWWSVHPRGCGERWAGAASAPPSSGSSPRVRGTLVRLAHARASRRFIPAGAGNALSRDALDARQPVHPRGCGERSSTAACCSGDSGSSPRVRGTHRHRARARIVRRFIPAGAGNAMAPRPARPPSPVHPRGCGERVAKEVGIPYGTGSSPRVRGTRGPPGARGPRRRFIPAGAGNARCKRQ